MDYTTLATAVAERLRTERVARRLEAARHGQTTRNFHRNQQVQQVSFLVMLGLSALAGLFLLAG